MKLGLLLFSQATTWRDFHDAALLADRLGYDHLWTWDHLYAIFGDPYQPIFEGWTALAALSGVTTRRSGSWSARTRSVFPGSSRRWRPRSTTLAKAAPSWGSAAPGFGLEHAAHGIDFGRGFGDRLRWLDESVRVMRDLLDGKEVTDRSRKYAFERARHAPPPVQRHLPIMVGGSGERLTLRTVVRYADMWNTSGTLDTLRRKDSVLRQHCRDVGRDERDIERTVLIRPVIREDADEAERVWRAQMAHNKCPIRRGMSRERWRTSRV